MNPYYQAITPQGEQQHVTESYVSVPPALMITDEQGDVWSLGLTQAPYGKSPNGEYAFPVLRVCRNGVISSLGEYASRIERRGGRIRIFTAEGWKRWTGITFV